MSDDEMKIEILKKIITSLHEANNTVNQRITSLENKIDKIQIQMLSIPNK